MARRLRIPFLLNAAVVSDEADMARLNNEQAIRRGLSGTGPWLHRRTRAWSTLATERALNDPDKRFLTPFLRDLLP